MFTITFKETVSFMGRNGYYNATGIHVESDALYDPPRVRVTPITSKGRLANCEIQIPKENIPDFINELQLMLLR